MYFFSESLDYRPLNDVAFNITSTNQNETQCRNIADFIINDSIVEEEEELNLILSVVQASFANSQLTFNRQTTEILILDDDEEGEIQYNYAVSRNTQFTRYTCKQ